jgi:hypothetical protein
MSRNVDGLEAGEFFEGVGSAVGTIGALEFFGEGLPLSGIEVAPVEEGVFEADGFVIEVVDGDDVGRGAQNSDHQDFCNG